MNIDPLTLFDNKAPHLPALYQQLINGVTEFCKFDVTASRKSITLYGQGHRAFLVLQPKRQWIDIWFPLGRKVEDFPVFKTQQRSEKSQVHYHYVRLQDEEDIEQVVLDWVAEAYQLTNS